MKVWLIGMGLALLSIIHVMAAETGELELQKITGSWFAHGLGTNSPMLLKHLEDMLITPAEMSLTEDGDLRMVSNFQKPNGCKRIDSIFTKGEDGKMVHKSECIEKTIEGLETDNKNYVIVTMQVTMKGRDCFKGKGKGRGKCNGNHNDDDKEPKFGRHHDHDHDEAQDRASGRGKGKGKGKGKGMGKPRTSTMVAVFGREVEMTPEAEEKFNDAAEAAGLTEEQITIFPEEVACMDSE